MILVCGQAKGGARIAPAGPLAKCISLEQCIGESLQPRVRHEVLRVGAPAGHPFRVSPVVGVSQSGLCPRYVAKTTVPIYEPR